MSQDKFEKLNDWAIGYMGEIKWLKMERKRSWMSQNRNKMLFKLLTRKDELSKDGMSQMEWVGMDWVRMKWVRMEWVRMEE